MKYNHDHAGPTTAGPARRGEQDDRRAHRRAHSGRCLQLGIGAIPDATGMALKSKHDLGIHTEMFTDSMVETHPSAARSTTAAADPPRQDRHDVCLGSQRIYDYIDDNPAVEILPVEYVNDPDVICQNDNMISINAAVEVRPLLGLRRVGRHEAYVRLRRPDRLCPRRSASLAAVRASSPSRPRPRAARSARSSPSSRRAPSSLRRARTMWDYIVTEYGVAHLRAPQPRRACLAS